MEISIEARPIGTKVEGVHKVFRSPVREQSVHAPVRARLEKVGAREAPESVHRELCR